MRLSRMITLTYCASGGKFADVAALFSMQLYHEVPSYSAEKLFDIWYRNDCAIRTYFATQRPRGLDLAMSILLQIG